MPFRDFVVKHRFSLQDGGLAIAVIFVMGIGAYTFSFTGSLDSTKQIEFEELIILAVVVFLAILYLGWRRVREQEREINRRIAAERLAHELAHTDSLTGLPNRREFERAVQGAIDAPAGAEELHAIIMIDLNGFKAVNDVYGHPEGDAVLATVAQRIKSVMRDGDIAARLGGDEFAVVAYHVAGAEGATNVAMRILKQIDAPIECNSRMHRIGAGVGIALAPKDGKTPDNLIRKADIALYRAKSEVQSAINFFEEEMDKHVRERDLIEKGLAAAIGTDSLRPWYQPIVDLQTGEIIEFEALARWVHPSLGQIPPERFIPVAEHAGLIRPLSDWLLRCAVGDAIHWPSNITLSFNISPAQLKDKTLSLRILTILGEFGLSPHRLEIEITESAIVRDLESAREVLSSLREAGIRIALDDFGTGYSSLYHLRNFKLDKIKIDRSFVHAMTSEPESAAIVRALSGLGNGLGLTITAEGIEGQIEREALRDLGCQQGQGFLFSEAVSAQATKEFFRAGTKALKTGAA